MSQYKVSIIIPLFNRKELIGETIESIINQSSSDWELLIIDDGSTDGADGIAKTYSNRDERIKFIKRNRKPKGAPTCRNIGVKLSSGNYIIFLDSDDLLASWCVEKRLELFQEHLNNDFLVFPMQFFKKIPGDTEKFWNKLDKPENDINRFLNFDTPWQTTCPIWKKSSFSKMNGLWKEEIKAKQDVEFHVRALAYKLTYKKFDNRYDCYYRGREYRNKRTLSLSSDVLLNNNKIHSWIDVIYLCERYLDINNSLNRERKNYLFNNLARLALNVYSVNKDFFNPSHFFRHTIVRTPKSFIILVSLHLLFTLERLKLRKIGMFIFGRLFNKFLYKD